MPKYFDMDQSIYFWKQQAAYAPVQPILVGVKGFSKRRFGIFINIVSIYLGFNRLTDIAPILLVIFTEFVSNSVGVVPGVRDEVERGCMVGQPSRFAHHLS